MSTYLPDQMRRNLRQVPERPRGRTAPGRRVRVLPITVRSGGLTWPVLRRTEGGFVIAAEHAAGLRGLVDLYEGGHHVMQCLVIGAATRAGETRFEFKRATPWRERAAPVDFVLDD